MKIGHLDNKPAVTPAATERRPAAADAAAQAAEPSAKVALSPAASALADAAGPDGSFDAAKVERIAQAIRDGKFEVNAEAIADRLIANAQELLGRSRA